MRSRESKTLAPTGMDCRPQGEAAPASCYLLENVVFDRGARAWSTSIGLELWEPLYPSNVLHSQPFRRAKTQRSLFEWTPSTGASYLFVEQDPALSPTPSGIVDLCWVRRGGTRTLVSGRTPVPGGNVYAPFADHVIVVNGADEPVKITFNGMVTPFGFPDVPPAPGIVGLDPTRMIAEGPEANLTDGGAAPYPGFHLDPSGSAWTNNGQYQRPGDSPPGEPWSGPTSRSYIGLGVAANGEESAYAYRVAFVSDTGSISALSPPTYVRWTIPLMFNDGLHKAQTVKVKPKYRGDGGSEDSVEITGNNPNVYLGTNEYEGNVSPAACKYAIHLGDLPRGPDNTVARILYRTRNLRDGIIGAGEVFYECAILPDNETTTYTDFKPDTELIVEAPTTDEAYTVDTRHTTAASWDNRLWLAGSSQNPNRLYYSAPGLPEQFGLTKFLDFSRSQGGAITGIASYQNMLVVLREFSIEAVTPGSAGGYVTSTLHSSVGSRARNALVPTPAGIMLVAEDGIYLADGSFSGGSQPRLRRLSDPVSKHFDRVNVLALGSAVGAYSPKWREAWFHLPVDTDTEPSLGFVFHLDTGGWSLRGLAEIDGPESETNPGTFYNPWALTSMTVDRNGEFLVAPIQQVDGTVTMYGGDIQVFTRSGSYAIKTGPWTVGESGYIDFTVASAPVYSTVMTSWLDAPEDKIQTMALEWSLIESDSVPFYSGWMRDRLYRWSDELRADPVVSGPAGPTIPIMPDERNSTEGSPLWAGPSGAANPDVKKPLAVYDVSRLADERGITVRIDLNPNIRDSALVYFRTDRPVDVTGFRWSVNLTGVKNQRGTR